MEVQTGGFELIDGSGRVTEAGTALLQQRAHDGPLAIVIMLGPPSSAAARRQTIAQMLRTPSIAQDATPTSGVFVEAFVESAHDDYRLLVLSIDDASLRIVGALCALSSIVMCMASIDDIPADASTTLPDFKPLQRTLEQLQQEVAMSDIFELMPNLLFVDHSSNRSLDESRSSRPLVTSDITSLRHLAQLKTLTARNATDLATEQPNTFFEHHAHAKKIFGCELTGELLLGMLRSLSQDLDCGEAPDVFSAWDKVVESKCLSVAGDALVTYTDCVQESLTNDADPIEMDALLKLHEDIERLALDIYRDETIIFKSQSRRRVRMQLKNDLKCRLEEGKRKLQEISRLFCKRTCFTLWEQISVPLKTAFHDNATDNKHLIRAVVDAISEFDLKFTEMAKGPAKQVVLLEFYQKDAIELFHQVEGLVPHKLSEADLRELREQLETEFTEKKEALVRHFKQEEAQLRVCMAREMETMQKLHHAKNTRVKIEESEIKRLRDEVAELRRTNEELVNRQVVSDQASETAKQQLQLLEAKVYDYERAMHQEVSSRAELLDTLATTIKASEEKEKSFQQRIEELQIDVKEKSSRMENELKDLSSQLKKTTEEKEELQKRLNEFFLRVTALPAALQEHLFCTDEDDKEVGFADALSTFMSK